MFTDRFIQILQEKNLTAYKVAKETGISQGLMNEYKNGVKLPTVQNLVKIADYLDCSVDYLLGHPEAPESAAVLFDSMTGPQFEGFVRGVLQLHGWSLQAAEPDPSADILCEKDGITYAVETKSPPDRWIRAADIRRIKALPMPSGACRVLLATPGRLTDQALQEAAQAGIDVWDRAQLIQLLAEA